MKNDGFSSHLAKRFFERYKKVISWADIDKMNVIANHSPQIRHTNVRYFDWEGVTVYVYMKNNKISTFLTEFQAKRDKHNGLINHDKTKPKRVEEGFFSVGESLKLVKT